MKQVPVYVLTGFLGSGKTTLLLRLLEWFKQQQLRPALIMNELGSMNVEQSLVDDNIPVSELLDGCICCSIRHTLSASLKSLYEEHQPDVIVIESTGVAHPLELLDEITTTTLLTNELSVQAVITVVAAPAFQQFAHTGSLATRKLFEEQIRCADFIILNKMDLLASQEDRNEMLEQVNTWNQYAKRIEVTRCDFPLTHLLEQKHSSIPVQSAPSQHEPTYSSHRHVMVYTHRWTNAIDEDAFETMMSELPSTIYRAKGIISFKGHDKPTLFQYAYRVVEMLPLAITPAAQGAVFIGEHFDKEQLKLTLAKTETDTTQH